MFSPLAGLQSKFAQDQQSQLEAEHDTPVHCAVEFSHLLESDGDIRKSGFYKLRIDSGFYLRS